MRIWPWGHRSQENNIEKTFVFYIWLDRKVSQPNLDSRRRFFDVVCLGSVIPTRIPHCCSEVQVTIFVVDVEVLVKEISVFVGCLYRIECEPEKENCLRASFS